MQDQLQNTENYLSKTWFTIPTMEVDITKISEKGQIVIPSNLRKEMGIKKSDQFLVFGEDSTIILKRLDKPEFQKSIQELSKPLQKAAKRTGLKRNDLKAAIEDVRRNVWFFTINTNAYKYHLNYFFNHATNRLI